MALVIRSLTETELRFGLGLHCEDIAQHNHHGGIDYDSMTRDYFLLLYPDMWLYTGAMGLSKMTALALYMTRYWILLLEGCVVWWMFARVSLPDIPRVWVVAADSH
jgi:hypothetical protein